VEIYTGSRCVNQLAKLFIWFEKFDMNVNEIVYPSVIDFKIIRKSKFNLQRSVLVDVLSCCCVWENRVRVKRWRVELYRNVYIVSVSQWCWRLHNIIAIASLIVITSLWTCTHYILVYAYMCIVCFSQRACIYTFYVDDNACVCMCVRM